MERKTLTAELQTAMEQLPQKRKNAILELRLRKESFAKAVLPWGEELLTLYGRPIPVTDKMLKELLDRATGFSPYALRMEETGLYLPLEDGCRMGLCGEAVVQEGQFCGLRNLSSVVIRFARQCHGIAEKTAATLTEGGYVQSALIISPPGRGKTTFLRDLIRAVSERGYRVSVADERRELAAVHNGVPQMDLGPSTDVLTGCPKAQAMEMLIRVMNPQVLAVDELAGQKEIQMAQEAANCGIALFATAHGDSPETLLRRSGYRDLVMSGAIAWCIVLKDFNSVRMERLGDYAENHRSLFCSDSVVDGRLGGAAGNAAASKSPPTTPSGARAYAGGNGTPYASGSRAV